MREKDKRREEKQKKKKEEKKKGSARKAKVWKLYGNYSMNLYGFVWISMEIPLCISTERKILLEILLVGIDEFYGL